MTKRQDNNHRVLYLHHRCTKYRGASQESCTVPWCWAAGQHHCAPAPWRPAAGRRQHHGARPQARHHNEPSAPCVTLLLLNRVIASPSTVVWFSQYCRFCSSVNSAVLQFAQYCDVVAYVVFCHQMDPHIFWREHESNTRLGE